MSNKTVYLDNIRARLGGFAYTLKMNGKVNRLGEHISAEDICCGLLNLVFDYELENANRGKANQIAVDLTDAENGIAVQITTTNTKQKAEHTIEGFRKGDLGRRFDTLMLLVMTGDDLFSGWKHLSCPDADLRILNFVELSNRMEHLPVKKLKAISDYLDEQLGEEKPEPTVQLPTHLLPNVPPATLSFVPGSRDRELEKLIPAAQSGQPVYIWGLGGMGKTQAAIQLARRMELLRGAYFLHYTLPMGGVGEAMRETILQANFSGYRFEGTDNESRDSEYRERMDILRSEYAGALLIIDNFDWPGKTLTQLQSEPSFVDLTRAGLKLVFTTRYAIEIPEWKIGPISDDALLALMRQSCTDTAVTNEDLLTLIRAVDGHTLMVDLMAKTMRRSRGRVTPETLLRALGDSGLDQEDFPDVASDRNTEHSQRQIYAHLKALFDLSAMVEDERAVLRFATLLPEDGMDYNLFRGTLEKAHRKLLDRLVDDSWLQCPETLLLIHPLVREVCRGELLTTDENCGDFLNALWNRCDFMREYDAVEYAQLAKCFSLASDRLEDCEGWWADYAGQLWGAIGQSRRALECQLKVQEIFEKVLPPEHPDLAASYNNVGVIYGTLGDYSKALEYQLKALEIWEKALPPVYPALANTYNNIGTVYEALGDPQQALEYNLKALGIWESVLPQGHLDLAASYNNVGITYGNLGDQWKALEYNLKALEINENGLPPDHPNLASSYNNVGYIYSNLGDQWKALEYLLKALGINENVLPPDHPALALSYNNVGMTYGALGDQWKALEYQLKALGIYENILPPDHPDLAVPYNNVSMTYGALGDQWKALEYQLKALGIWESVLPPEHLSIALCYNNVGATYFNLGEDEKALVYLEKALAIQEKKLPAGYPHLEQSRQNIAIVKERLAAQELATH